MRTLFSRMLTTYLSICFGILLLLAILTTQLFTEQILADLKREMRREIEEVNRILVEKYVHEEQRTLAREELLTIARKYNACIQVMDNQNAQAWTIMDPEESEMWASCGSADLTDWTARVLAAGTIETSEFFSKSIVDEVMSFGKVLVNAGHPEGAIFFHISIRDVNGTIRQVYGTVAVIAAAVVALAIAAVYMTARRFTRPLMQMNATLERYSRGEYDARIPVDSLDEIGRLSGSFNEMADAIGELESMRRSFVANVSHELRSPLAGMRGFLEGMLDGVIPPAEYKKTLEIVLLETNRLTSLVNDLLDLARIESGELPMQQSVFDINELLLRILLTFEKRIEEKNIEIKINYRQNYCFVEADSGMITLVVRNLLDNAIKFTPQGGSITVDSNWRHETSFIAVTDTGQGIPAEDLPFIFERFFKVEKAHTPGGGTGLGLSIVKRIIDQHGQRIRAFSSAQGTRFVFTLKIAPEQKRKAKEEQG